MNYKWKVTHKSGIALDSTWVEDEQGHGVAVVDDKYAHLIAAAPDMYEALKKLIPELKRRHYIIPQSYEKALAKAEGGVK